MKGRLRIAALAVLLVGLAAGLALYLLADEESANMAMQEILQSKRYQRELLMFGGKASVVFDDILQWLDGLWHGKSLGVTVAWLGAGTSALLYFISTR